MTARLTTALEELVPHLSTRDVARSVERVDVRSDGSLGISIVESGRARWFVHDDRGLVEHLPRLDKRVPMASRLRSDDSLLAYRPGRRIVLARSTRGYRTIVKGYRPRRSEEAARLHRIAEVAANAHTFRVPKLFFHGADAGALVFEEVTGRRLLPVEPSTDTFFGIGVFLGQFQAAAPNSALTDFTTADELRVLERWERRVRLVTERLPEGWEDALERVRAWVERLPTARLGLCHRDLHDGQFLDTRLGIALFDYDLLCRSDTALDPANLLAHLTLRALQRMRGTTEAGAHATGEAFLDGLDPFGDETFGARLRFYQSTTFLRLALVYALRPRWQHLSITLTQLGARCVDEIEARC